MDSEQTNKKLSSVRPMRKKTLKVEMKLEIQFLISKCTQCGNVVVVVKLFQRNAWNLNCRFELYQLTHDTQIKTVKFDHKKHFTCCHELFFNDETVDPDQILLVQPLVDVFVF